MNHGAWSLRSREAGEPTVTQRRTIHGQPSYLVANDSVGVWMSALGGQTAPVTFRLDGREVRPFHVAPWADEELSDELPILRALRGDFFCMPFGANAEPFGDEIYPLHGETANEAWTPTTREGEFVLRTRVRPGRVVKQIALQPGHTAMYVSHVIEGMAGPMTCGHHAMLRFQSPGLLSVSPFAFGQVYPGEFELPSRGGYSSLRPGARFSSLASVPRLDGGVADLSRYPAREGFEDLVQVFSRPSEPFAWNAVTFPEERYVWFALRNPRVLTGTILWHSNGGRHYAPWRGRHRGVLGIEDVTSYMHDGLTRSVKANPALDAGIATFVEMSPEVPLRVATIFGVAPVPAGFGHVTEMRPIEGGIELSDGQRRTRSALDLEFLAG